MLAKKNRLTKKRDFEKVYKKCKTFKGDFLILKIAPNGLPTNRFAFIVSHKVSKKAVIRNKVKRRLRELIRSNVNNWGAGRDFIFIALPGLEKKKFCDAKKILDSFLGKLKTTK